METTVSSSTNSDLEGQLELPRALGLLDSALLVIGSIIGSGIFLTPSNIARTVHTVEGLLLVWVVGGILSFCGALSYAELGAAFPKAGGIYVFLREAYGPLPAFLYGWCTFFVMQSGSIATLASAFAIYLGYLSPLPPWLTKTFAVSCIALLTLINCLGVRSGALVQNFLTVVKIGSLVGISLVLFFSSEGSAQHFLNVTVPASPFSLSAFGIAMIAALWAYEGWHLLTFAAGEVKNPQKNLTGGLLFGTLVAIVLYLTVNLAYLWILPFDRIAGSSRVASDAMERALGPVGGTLIALAILISITGATNSNVLAGPRVYFAMARQKLFFKQVASVHPRYRVPVVSIILQGIWAIVLTLVGNFERLFSYVIFVAWIFYALGGAAVLVLRWKQPDLERPYKVWGYPFVPLLFVLMAAAIVLNTIFNDFKNSFWGLVVVLSGLPAYFYWSRKAEGRKQ
jgi:APA family basic amino acid/polyamine antiporter